MTHTFEFYDRTVEATFDNPGAVDPEDAIDEIRCLLMSAGGSITDVVPHTEQSAKNKVEGDGEYITTDIRVELPSGRRVWLGVECPTDKAYPVEEVST